MVHLYALRANGLPLDEAVGRVVPRWEVDDPAPGPEWTIPRDPFLAAFLARCPEFERFEVPSAHGVIAA